MGRSERDKGGRGERLLRDELNDVYGFNVRRGFLFYGEQDVVGLEGIHIECKFTKEIKISTWVKQAVESAEQRQDGIPAVFHKVNRKPWLVTMLVSDFAKLHPDGRFIKSLSGRFDLYKEIEKHSMPFMARGLIYTRKCGDVITMPLEEWVGFYVDWKEGK